MARGNRITAGFVTAVALSLGLSIDYETSPATDERDQAPARDDATAATMRGVLHSNASCQPQWLPTFGGEPGVDHSVTALSGFDDGTGGGPALYAGGGFTEAGGVSANYVAKWDGRSWSALGSGLNSVVDALTVFDDGKGGGPALYAGGIFTSAGGVSANRIAKWDGSSWSAPGSGVNNKVLAFTVFDDGKGGGPALYAGGSFTIAGGVSANRIAKWDGSSWSPLSGGVNNEVRALIVFDDGTGGGPALYAGGVFTSAGGVSANHIAKWDGSSWSPLGSGVNNGVVSALAVFDDDTGGGPALYAGGSFSSAGGLGATRIAKWDGSSWSALGAGVDNGIHTLTVFDDGTGGGSVLCAGGLFTSAGGVGANHVAAWDGASWSALGSGIGPFYVKALMAFDDGKGGGPALYAGGFFGTAGDVGANNVARWGGSSWSALGGGLNDEVFALTTFDDGKGGGPALYAGGDFISVGGVSEVVARWDGSSWSALGSGMNDEVFALAVFDDGAGGGPALYAGGSFTTAGDVGANRIAKWDGSSWSALGSGIDCCHRVRALAVSDDGAGGGPALYAGGLFSTAGGVRVNSVARWDGSLWSALGSGVNNEVLALTVFDDGTGGGPALYAGGLFTTAGGVSANYVARWDGSSWSALGTGMNNWVYALAVFDDGTGGGPALYAGGYFTSAGGVSANRIAKWNGSSWSALGSGVNVGVEALTVFDDGTGDGPALYAGGSFTTAGGVSANHVAKWDGSAWSALGSGVNDLVDALTVFDDGTSGGPALCAGGGFTLSPAGDSYVAKWQGCPLCPWNCQAVPDGLVSISDLLALLAQWGLAAACDIDGDGVVGIADLLDLLGHWGPCP